MQLLVAAPPCIRRATRSNEPPYPTRPDVRRLSPPRADGTRSVPATLLCSLAPLPAPAADLAKARSLLMHGRYEEAAEIYKPEAAAIPRPPGLGRLPGVARQDRRGGRGPQAVGRQAGGDPGPIGPAGLRARRLRSKPAAVPRRPCNWPPSIPWPFTSWPNWPAPPAAWTRPRAIIAA